MEFIEVDLETILPILDKLSPDTKALWGKMSAQRMVEHLTDSVKVATGENPQELIVEEEKIPRMLAFLDSDKEMAQNIQVPFAKEDEVLRHEEIELAIDEFVETFIEFEELYEQNPNLTHVHPFYGPLNFEQWKRLNAKHLTHHFKQFGLI
jgi:hydroxymethylglutaryl-CoA reductase